jgi:hypothetical protein
MDKAKRRPPARGGADDNNLGHCTSPLRRDQGFERRWRRERPEEFDAIDLARAVGAVDHAIDHMTDDAWRIAFERAKAAWRRCMEAE